MIIFVWWLFIGTSVESISVNEIIDELSWPVKIKLWNTTEQVDSTEMLFWLKNNATTNSSRRVGIEALVARRQGKGPTTKISLEENNVRLKLFRLMYETVKDSDLKVKRAELIQDHYSNLTAFQIGYLMGDITDKFNIMADISKTLKKFYVEWKPIEHINAYEQISNHAIEISHLIEMVRLAKKKENEAQDGPANQ